MAVPIDARDAPGRPVVVRPHRWIGLRALFGSREGGAGRPRFRDVQGSVGAEDEPPRGYSRPVANTEAVAVRARLRDEAASVGAVPWVTSASEDHGDGNQ